MNSLMKCCKKLIDDIETFNDPVLRRKRTFQREMLPYLKAGFVFTVERIYGNDDNDSKNDTGIVAESKPNSSGILAAKSMVSSAFESFVKVASASASVLDTLSKPQTQENIAARNEMIIVTMDESLPPRLSWITLKNEKNVPKAKGSIPLRLIQVIVAQDARKKVCMKTHTGEVLFLVQVSDPEEGQRFITFMEEALAVMAPEIEDDSQSLKGGFQNMAKYLRASKTG